MTRLDTMGLDNGDRREHFVLNDYALKYLE